MEDMILTDLGLTEAESKIYFAVLKLKTCTVRDITKECGFHRTNIYDILEQLREKGLISIHKEGKTTRYSASDPNNLYELLREKKELLDSIFPSLEKFYKSSSDEIKVEVFKGDEGMKSAWRDMIREGKPLYGFGIKGQLREKLPVFAEQWLRDVKNKKIPYYGIYTKRGNLPSYYTQVKFVSEELSSPVATFIYGDKININIWDPTLVCIVIKSKLVAEMYKKHFDLLWKIAKK
ncbi:BlaI/MecI/CopY family transcriptional regulator [Candidatus Pacearchaeota archaeon]|nr:BlaI/MecI/CopY family transcriptional regulator [Candidatus Pacearchaeota archaeon]